MTESPLFARAYDLAKVTLQIVEKLPRSRRAVLGRRLEEAALDLHRHLTAATKNQGASLAAADTALTEWKFAARLAHDLGLFSTGRYEEISRLAAECGRLLGAWRKKAGK